jgi:AGZA family xanthine/uracil permease-like MFS transporter
MEKKYQWATSGDVNAFFGLVLDNLAGLILIVSLLSTIFQFPVEFALRHLVPGTAIGVFVGDLLYFLLAFHLASKTGRSVTAMPLGLDTPSTFGTALFVLGPAFLHAKNDLGMAENEAATYAWHIGICALLVSGVFKVFCAFGSNWIHRLFPRAGLLGSLAAIALVLISFLPLLEVMHYPVVGLASTAIILITLIGRVPLPGNLPGTVGALLVGGVVYYVMANLGWLHNTSISFNASAALLPNEWLSVWNFQWLSRMSDTIPYLPIVIPFALGTVVGGIDCAESAAAAGDKYNTSTVIGIEAIATIAAALCGGVVQTTPYIGHPAYKAMGGRAAYTLATALFVGAAGVLGFFGYVYEWTPKPAVYPILLFIGLEITGQSFIATPKRHYPAIAFACVPALALLSIHFVGQIWGDPAANSAGLNPGALKGEVLKSNLSTAMLLSNGFLIVSLLWSSCLALAIDRKLHKAAICMMVAAIFTLFGIIHSPFPSARLFLPGFGGNAWFGPSELWLTDAKMLEQSGSFALAYIVTATLLWVWHLYLMASDQAELPEDFRDAGEGV